ncbi:hypothetical protein DIPPA_19844 [Diplonema papillatum]|nr:hypothetical protein DIPPA_19844 [Diplonema papillatum]
MHVSTAKQGPCPAERSRSLSAEDGGLRKSSRSTQDLLSSVLQSQPLAGDRLRGETWQTWTDEPKPNVERDKKAAKEQRRDTLRHVQEDRKLEFDGGNECRQPESRLLHFPDDHFSPENLRDVVDGPRPSQQDTACVENPSREETEREHALERELERAREREKERERELECKNHELEIARERELETLRRERELIREQEREVVERGFERRRQSAPDPKEAWDPPLESRGLRASSRSAHLHGYDSNDSQQDGGRLSRRSQTRLQELEGSFDRAAWRQQPELPTSSPADAVRADQLLAARVRNHDASRPADRRTFEDAPLLPQAMNSSLYDSEAANTTDDRIQDARKAHVPIVADVLHSEFETLQIQRRQLEQERLSFAQEKRAQEEMLRRQRVKIELEAENRWEEEQREQQLSLELKYHVEQARVEAEAETVTADETQSSTGDDVRVPMGDELHRLKERTARELVEADHRYEAMQDELSALREQRGGPGPSPGRGGRVQAKAAATPPQSQSQPQAHAQVQPQPRHAPNKRQPGGFPAPVVVDLDRTVPQQQQQQQRRSASEAALGEPSMAAIPQPTKTVVGSVQPPLSPSVGSKRKPNGPAYKGIHTSRPRRGSGSAASQAESDEFPTHTTRSASAARGQRDPAGAPKLGKPGLSEAAVEAWLRPGGGIRERPVMSRFDALYRHSHEISEKLRASRRQQLLDEMQECTFKPGITRHKGVTRSWARATGSSAQSSASSKAGHRTTHEAKELEEASECTFKPRIGAFPKGQHQPSGGAKIPGYAQAVRRVQDARCVRKVLTEHSGNTYGSKPPGGKWGGAPTVPEPFEFTLPKRKLGIRREPNVFVDVTIGRTAQVSGRIGVYEGDDPTNLVDSFAKVYNLDPHQRERLYHTVHNVMLQHISSYRASLAIGSPPSTRASS